MKRPTWTIVWTEEMSVGIDEMDQDHKKCFSLIHALNYSITAHMPPAEIRNRLQLIVADALRHFGEEEKLFKEWNYPNTLAHALRHAQIAESLNYILDHFEPYGHDSSWLAASLNVKNLLLKHFLTEDMVYAKFYRNFLAAQAGFSDGGAGEISGSAPL